MAEKIPDEVMVEILSRLPAKSLCKSRCVSKFWCNLTLDSNFTKLHLSRAIQRDSREIIVNYFKNSCHGEDGKEGTLEELRAGPSNGIYTVTRSFIYCVDVDVASLGKSHEIDVSMGDYWRNCKLLGSCNGIVCLGWDYRICLLNPCTREYKIHTVQMDNICYDNGVIYDFGYDSREQVYTLVQVDESADSEFEISVYSLCDNDTCCSKVSNVPYRILLNSGVFLNGAFHWVARYKYDSVPRIISFDVGSKLVVEFSKPKNLPRDELDELYPYFTVGVIEGNLALFKRDYTIVEIWVMQVYGVADSWCKLFSIKGARFWISDPGRSYFDRLDTRPLYFTKNAQLLINNDKTVVMYDMKRNTTRELDILAILRSYQNNRIVIHVPSLISLESGTYVGTAIRDGEKEKTQGFRFSFRS